MEDECRVSSSVAEVVPEALYSLLTAPSADAATPPSSHQGPAAAAAIDAAPPLTLETPSRLGKREKHAVPEALRLYEPATAAAAGAPEIQMADHDAAAETLHADGRAAAAAPVETVVRCGPTAAQASEASVQWHPALQYVDRTVGHAQTFLSYCEATAGQLSDNPPCLPPSPSSSTSPRRGRAATFSNANYCRTSQKKLPFSSTFVLRADGAVAGSSFKSQRNLPPPAETILLPESCPSAPSEGASTLNVQSATVSSLEVAAPVSSLSISSLYCSVHSSYAAPAEASPPCFVCEAAASAATPDREEEAAAEAAVDLSSAGGVSSTGAGTVSAFADEVSATPASSSSFPWFPPFLHNSASTSHPTAAGPNRIGSGTKTGCLRDICEEVDTRERSSPRSVKKYMLPTARCKRRSYSSTISRTLVGVAASAPHNISSTSSSNSDLVGTAVSAAGSSSSNAREERKRELIAGRAEQSTAGACESATASKRRVFSMPHNKRGSEGSSASRIKRITRSSSRMGKRGGNASHRSSSGTVVGQDVFADGRDNKFSGCRNPRDIQKFLTGAAVAPKKYSFCACEDAQITVVSTSSTGAAPALGLVPDISPCLPTAASAAVTPGSRGHRENASAHAVLAEKMSVHANSCPSAEVRHASFPGDVSGKKRFSRSNRTQ